MQPKVSIVIPCYNKEKYICVMFDSIIAQNWDNIEIILVNDGSTDGVREIIAEYEKKFRKRGFDMIIVDQENRGLPSAAYEGLKRASGEFVCQVDADDELDPLYVSTMAGWLAGNPDYDWTVCDLLFVYSDYTIYQSWHCSDIPKSFIFSNITECFLLSKIVDTVPGYMVRSSYMKRSGLLDNYYFKIRRTQEPQYIIPLGLLGGKLKHFPISLYNYIQNDSMMSLEGCENNLEQFLEINKKVIENLDTTTEYKKRLVALANMTYYRRNYNNRYIFSRFNTHLENHTINRRVLDYFNSVFSPSPNLTEDDLYYPRCLFAAAENCILHYDSKTNFTPAIINSEIDKVIAWGAMASIGSELLTYLKGTALEPNELWDIRGDGFAVKKPNPSNLNDRDMVLILPSDQDIVAEILKELEKNKCKKILLNEVAQYAAECFAPVKYPQFYDGRIVFNP